MIRDLCIFVAICLTIVVFVYCAYSAGYNEAMALFKPKDYDYTEVEKLCHKIAEAAIRYPDSAVVFTAKPLVYQITTRPAMIQWKCIKCNETKEQLFWTCPKCQATGTWCKACIEHHKTICVGRAQDITVPRPPMVPLTRFEEQVRNLLATIRIGGNVEAYAAEVQESLDCGIDCECDPEDW